MKSRSTPARLAPSILTALAGLTGAAKPAVQVGVTIGGASLSGTF